MSSTVSRLALLVVVTALTATFAGASVTEALPTAMLHDGVLAVSALKTIEIPSIDRDAVALEDEARARAGLAPRYAIPTPVSITPHASGDWEDIGLGERLWRLRIRSVGAVSINLGFGQYFMPKASKLLVYAADGSYVVGPFTADDNADHGELWTPVILSDDIVVELTIPTKEVGNLKLELSSINVGYRGFGEILSRNPGYCNNDVVCPIADGWRDEIPSVAVISTGGSLFCTGFMVNNTAEDGTPYFMTANHCGINSGNAASLVAYWNYESEDCGDLGGGSLSEYQTGSYFRASYSTSDFTLVEMDSDPDPSYGVTFAGWDHSGANATSAVGIHQPDASVKCISFEDDATQTTSYLGTSSPGDGSHVRVVDWDSGTTEPGSSGSPLFDQNHHVIGQLHGGYAACGNDDSDYYGRFSMSWTGGGTSSSRLSNWLDPTGSGATSVDTYVPGATGIRVTPSSDFASSGDAGGPFTPSQTIYTVENLGDSGLDYSVNKSASWITLTNASGHLNSGQTAQVTVAINSAANSLDSGTYTDVVSFVNETDHEGDTARDVELTVGTPSLVLSFPMDSNPGWSTTGSWAYGQPTGGGGEHGYPDPTSGHTGSNVCGYNLSGDYTNNLPERNLTTTAIDCSDLSSVSLKFWRWLGVERNSYDHAYVRVSNDGTNWTTVWANPDSHIEDSAWTQVEYDISDVADGESTVYVRWVMGETDGSWTFCGWNIDDVEIWGIQSGPSDVADGAITGVSLSPSFPNPFGPATTVRFELPQRSHVSLRVYDVAGRLVRVLADVDMPAGSHIASWDARDDSGRLVAAGVYFCRLAAGDRSETRRMVLIR
jgi:hypothetical protein